MSKEKKEESVPMSYEPTGNPEYEHDFYNMTDKEKARAIVDQLMFDYLANGGAIKKVPPKKD